MIENNTVLVLGAGASIPYGFPSGLQLKAHICKAIKKKNSIYEDLLLNKDEELVEDFYNNLLLSSEMSIDAFLEHNEKYFEIGRRAIANILLRKEIHNEMYDNWIEKWLDPKNQDKHWYQLLFSKLNAPFEEFENNNLKIITFNYDRSLEYFLLEAMKAKYSEKDDKDILKKLHIIPILHVYGKLGSLPEYDSDGTMVPYDLFRKADIKDKKWWRGKVYEASKNIITIHQAEEMKVGITKAQEFMLWSNRIYFLGFGYDKTNMQQLFFDNDVNLLKDKGLGSKCFGTALDLSPHHKRYLSGLGLNRMEYDLVNERQGLVNKPKCFPNSTIYDFLHYNPNSLLD